MKEKKKGGRPSLSVDWNKADKYFEAGANGKMVAAKLGVSYDTLVNRFKDRNEMENMGFANLSDYIQHKRAGGKADLFLAQHEKAIKDKDKTLLVFLGKTELGQIERREIEVPEWLKSKDINFTIGESMPRPRMSEDDVMKDNDWQNE